MVLVFHKKNKIKWELELGMGWKLGDGERGTVEGSLVISMGFGTVYNSLSL